jgi:hypothetical protein
MKLEKNDRIITNADFERLQFWQNINESAIDEKIEEWLKYLKDEVYDSTQTAYKMIELIIGENTRLKNENYSVRNQLITFEREVQLDIKHITEMIHMANELLKVKNKKKFSFWGLGKYFF